MRLLGEVEIKPREMLNHGDQGLARRNLLWKTLLLLTARRTKFQSRPGPWPCCQHHTSLPLSCLHSLENESHAILQTQSWIKIFQNISTACAGAAPMLTVVILTQQSHPNGGPRWVFCGSPWG